MIIINAMIMMLIKVYHNSSKNGPLISILLNAFMKREWGYNNLKISNKKYSELVTYMGREQCCMCGQMTYDKLHMFSVTC